ncbi:MAG: RDD family protein [Candidatus Heimdallarchaeota archaeon]|nr:RDD family protein [Candidatus Heimdallarchaeota archaeon]
MNMQEHEIKIYLDRVSSYLPFSGEQKEQLLRELRPELEEAIETNQSLDKTFGDPQMTAKNLLKTTQFDYEFATWKRRITAYMIDTGIIWVFLLIFVGIPLYLADAEYDLERDWSEFNTSEITIMILLILYSSSIFIIGFSYYIIPERLYGQTIGKRLLGIHVMDISGIRIGWKQAIVRNIAKYNTEFLPLEFILGWLIRKGDESIQKATDTLAETRVVMYKSEMIQQ